MQRLNRVGLLLPVFVLFAFSGCHRPPPNLPKTYTIGGNVAGLSGSLVLQLNGANNLSLSAAGSFTFGSPLLGGDTYAVTVLTAKPTKPAAIRAGLQPFELAR